jgi:hypothetical protein
LRKEKKKSPSAETFINCNNSLIVMNASYLIAVLLYFPSWLFLYIHRKDLRKEILTMGSIVTLGALYLEAFIWTRDWWQPQTITGTIIGIEDVLFGFFAGGIIVSIYEEIFKEKLVNIRGKKNNHLKHFLIVLITSAFVGSLTFFYFNVHSYYASLLAMIIPTLLIYFYRKDLIVFSLTSGGLITLVSLPVYWILFFLDPSAIGWWFHDNISGIMILAIPIEDLIWFFVTGIFIAPIYELWKGKKLKKIK